MQNHWHYIKTIFKQQNNRIKRETIVLRLANEFGQLHHFISYVTPFIYHTAVKRTAFDNHVSSSPILDRPFSFVSNVKLARKHSAIWFYEISSSDNLSTQSQTGYSQSGALRTGR